MPELSTRIRAVQATSILMLATYTGASSALSLFLVPRLLESPTPIMLRQWRNMSTGPASRTLPALCVLPSLLNVYLATYLPSKVRAYAFAAVVSLSILPWSEFIMGPLDRMLCARAERERVNLEEVIRELQTQELEAGVSSDVARDSPKAMLDSWGIRNLYRSATALVSACIGLYAALS
jgi:hypothetical protein